MQNEFCLGEIQVKWQFRSDSLLINYMFAQKFPIFRSNGKQFQSHNLYVTFSKRVKLHRFSHTIYMWHFWNVLNGDFPARLWLTPILTNLNWNMGAGVILVLHKMLTFSRTLGLILGFRGFKSSSNNGNSFFIVWWPWKLGQGQQNLTNSFNYPTDTIHKVWSESVVGSRERVQTNVRSIFYSQSAVVTLK